ncbi:MAG: DNA-3-methyladenine glycosylase [Rickettsiales bacterium]
MSVDFFMRPTLEAARELLGKRLFFKGKYGYISETEAYVGQDDPASHAARGKTPRNAPMFYRGGFSYVYFIYGMYYCINIVTERENFPSAVLIRGLVAKESAAKTDGPGKLARYLGVTTAHSGIDLTQADDFFVAEGISLSDDKVERTPRVGIRVGLEKPWRFLVKDKNFLA